MCELSCEPDWNCMEDCMAWNDGGYDECVNMCTYCTDTCWEDCSGVGCIHDPVSCDDGDWQHKK
jgi:hypothetical protein